MSNRRLIVILTITASLVIGAVFFFFDPAKGGFYPPCMFHQLTGLSCPGCGSLRALHYLTHGEIATAFGSNPLLVVLLPLLAFLIARWLKHGRGAFQGNPLILRPATAWTLLAVTLAFTVLRNLPWPAFAWMSP
jgi:hypothetical protein